MLSGGARRAAPFDCFTVEAALSEDLLARLEALRAEGDLAWEHHRVSFYEALLCDVTARLEPAPLEALRAGVAHWLGLPLAPGVTVTLQRMAPGHRADPHTDRPLVGYEAARLVVQLTRGWAPGDGGVFLAFADPAGPPALRRPPIFNQGFGFALTRRAHHAVTPTARERLSAVFNFWHVGNTSALGEATRAFFAGMRFADLPPALDPLVAAAEAAREEAACARAAAAAWALWRWGRPSAEVVTGYQQALAGGPIGGGAIGLARWLERLHRVDFDPALWARLAPAQAAALAGPAEALRRLAFPAVRAPGCSAPSGDPPSPPPAPRRG